MLSTAPIPIAKNVPAGLQTKLLSLKMHNHKVMNMYTLLPFDKVNKIC